MTSPNCTKYKFQGLPMEFNWNMGKLICSHLVWKSFDWAWTAHRTSAIHSLSPLPASESESRKTEKSKAARRSIHYWVTPVLQVTSILTMITLKSTFWKTSHKVKMSNRQLAIEDWREEWGRSLPSIGSFRVQLCPLPCLWRYHRSWWPGQGWGPRPAAGPTQPQAPPRRGPALSQWAPLFLFSCREPSWLPPVSRCWWASQASLASSCASSAPWPLLPQSPWWPCLSSILRVMTPGSTGGLLPRKYPPGWEGHLSSL